MIVTRMNQLIEEDTKNMGLLSQFYPEVFPTAGMVPLPQQGESSCDTKAKPQRPHRKRNNGDDARLSRLKKRKLTDEQTQLLEMHYTNDYKLETDRKDKLAMEVGLDPRQVAVWFQNRRARGKAKKIEESYASLKITHENLVVEKGRLESEVVSLKEKLSNAENEIKRLTELFGGVFLNSAPSPNPTLPPPVETETVDSPPFASVDSSFPNMESPVPSLESPFVGWFTYEDIYYMLERNYISVVEWLLYATACNINNYN